jgi:hypothetical protein
MCKALVSIPGNENKIALKTGWLKNYRSAVLIVLEVGKPEIKTLETVLPGECPVLIGAASSYDLTWQKRQAPSGLFSKSACPICEEEPSKSTHLPKGPTLNTIILEFRFQHMNFKGIQTFRQ